MSSNNIRHFITSTIIKLQHSATLHHTSPNYTSLHLSTLHFLSYTLHYSSIWLNPSTFPIVLFHLISLNQTQCGSHIPKLISKIMNPFTVLKNLSIYHFISLFIFYFILFFFTQAINPSLQFTLLFTSITHFPSLHFPSNFTFYRLHFPAVLHIPNPRFENTSFTVGSPYRPSGSWFQSVMDLFTNEYFPMSVLCFMAQIFQR